MLVAMVLSVPVLTGCSDDDDIVKTPLGEPELASEGVTVSTLDFSWDKVDGAIQYGYELADPNGEVVAADVTNSTSAHFTGLAESTTYTLIVKAFANVNSTLTTSKVVTLTATTAARVALDTPSGLVATAADGGGIVITWDAVEHATRYYYTYEGSDVSKSSSTSKTKVTLTGLPVGEYTFTLYADSSEEAYKESETAQISFTRIHYEVSRISGEYYSAVLNDTWPADLVGYDDGSYAIEKWYGADGYDFEFSINSDGSINILNYTKSGSGWYYVPSGSSVGTVEIYNYGEYSGYEEGYIWLYAYGSSNNVDGYDQFTWDAGLSVNTLVGTYTETSSGQSWMVTWNDWSDIQYTMPNVKISKVDDTTISVEGLFEQSSYYLYKAVPLIGTVDIEARKIYFEPQPMDEYYTFAYQTSETQKVTATINEDGSISMNKWSLWYDGGCYLYSMKTVLTR